MQQKEKDLHLLEEIKKFDGKNGRRSDDTPELEERLKKLNDKIDYLGKGDHVT